MLAGNERQALLRAADRLGAELGYAEGEELPGVDSGLGSTHGAMGGLLGPEDELLVAKLRRGLARIAAALGGDPFESTVGGALDGIEMAMRGELAMGNASQLPALMPGFVFLVVLPVVDQEEALGISRRAAALVEEELG